MDANQAEIVREIRAYGCSVYIASSVGTGFPDLVIGYRGKNYLVEVKTGTGKLNQLQEDFRRGWKGQYTVITKAEDFIQLIRK